MKLFDKQMHSCDVDVKLTDVKEVRTDCEHRNEFEIVCIDVYRSDRIACMLDYEKSPSLFMMVDEEAKEYYTDLSALLEKVEAAIGKYGDTVNA